ncbi:nucleotidyltransferase domain-containing protein [Micromonospora sp. RP3T]|uniref:nucleotidyltransferase domain-containing protein n=1 Tax=Micromonospora sp. RP3T TaxID=2135446 RepID=UPI003D71BBD7
MTELVLEHWGVDPEQIVAGARHEVGDADLYLGGSLADDLGSPDSDIDLYCFVESGGSGTRRLQLTGYAPVVLELHVVDVNQELATGVSLAPFVIEADPLPPARWPILSGTAFRAFHALFYDRPLAPPTGPADRMRSGLGTDLLPIYVVLRSALAASSLDRQADRRATESTLSAVHCARLGVEAALDAALATAGAVSANPKWRLTLARRHGLLSDGTEDLVLAGIFPDRHRADDAVARCHRATARLLDRVRQDAFLARYPVVRATSGQVDHAAETERAPA